MVGTESPESVPLFIERWPRSLALTPSLQSRLGLFSSEPLPLSHSWPFLLSLNLSLFTSSIAGRLILGAAFGTDHEHRSQGLEEKEKISILADWYVLCLWKAAYIDELELYKLHQSQIYLHQMTPTMVNSLERELVTSELQYRQLHQLQPHPRNELIRLYANYHLLDLKLLPSILEMLQVLKIGWDKFVRMFNVASKAQLYQYMHHSSDQLHL